MKQFWRAASVRPFPASEVALYAFLVNECNAYFWKMPVPCPTLRICESLRISKQTVMAARKHLAECGLIQFTNGKSRFLPSEYSLLDLTADLTHGLTLNNNKGKDKDYCKTQKTSSYYDSNSSKNRRRAVEVHTTSAEDWKSHTNLTHPGKYFRPSKVKIMRPTSPK